MIDIQGTQAHNPPGAIMYAVAGRYGKPTVEGQKRCTFWKVFLQGTYHNLSKNTIPKHVISNLQCHCSALISALAACKGCHLQAHPDHAHPS